MTRVTGVPPRTDLVAHAERGVHALHRRAYVANRAATLGARSAFILSAILHDIGHLLEHHEPMAELGVKDHEHIGADDLSSLGFSKQVCELVCLDVNAKRYLCTKVHRPQIIYRSSPVRVQPPCSGKVGR